MANESKNTFLEELTNRFGPPKRLAGSQSLFDLGKNDARIYVRYSTIHPGNKTFYGLREQDLRRLEGSLSFICFLWNEQSEPLLIPYSAFEDVFQSSHPASDGQYKVQVYIQEAGSELYIAKQGRFNVEAYMGWQGIEAALSSLDYKKVHAFSHVQIQTFLGAIGTAKDFEVWIPKVDRVNLDWAIVDPFECSDNLPTGFDSVKNILQEIDVVWFRKGSNDLRALFEVEHSTPVYSGLLRFNDLYISSPRLKPRFSIVANDTRRTLFARQVNRPTFQASGLSDLCTFLDYTDVFGWYSRLRSAN